MNARSICFTAAAVGFYLAEILLFANLASVAGAFILTMSMLVLLAGIFFRPRTAEGKTVWLENSMESAAAI